MITRLINVVLTACVSIAMPSVLYGQSNNADAERILLSMPEPPDGCSVTKQRIEADNKDLGIRLLILNEDLACLTVVTVETSYDRSSTPARVAATKAHINSTAVVMKDAGFELIESKLPDVERETFAAPTQADMTFANSDGERIYVRQYSFFTNVGYSVLVRASNAEELESLSKWAKHIRPATHTEIQP
jgi:hypothetical protein